MAPSGDKNTALEHLTALAPFDVEEVLLQLNIDEKVSLLSGKISMKLEARCSPEQARTSGIRVTFPGSPSLQYDYQMAPTVSEVQNSLVAYLPHAFHAAQQLALRLTQNWSSSLAIYSATRLEQKAHMLSSGQRSTSNEGRWEAEGLSLTPRTLSCPACLQQATSMASRTKT